MPAAATGPGTGAARQEREPDAATDVSAPWVRLRQQGKGRFSQTTASTLMAGADQLRLPVLTSDPAACQGTREHTFHGKPGQARRPRPPPMICVWISADRRNQQAPSCRKARLAQADLGR
jgi:hypothetical protein